jgi:type IV secretory pathway VirB10-like protein
MSSGEEVVTPSPKRLGPRALAAIGVVLCLVVGGIIASVFRDGGSKGPAAVSRENPERPSEPRFLDRQPGEGADRFAAEIEARQREQERRRAELREMLAAPAPPQAAAASPFFRSGADPGDLEDRRAAIAAGGAENEIPPGVYRPIPIRSAPALTAVPAESRNPSALARALEAPVLLGAAKDQPADLPGGSARARFPLTPPPPPDFKSLLAQLQPTAGREAVPQVAPTAPRVDFGRVVWAPAILLTALSSESPGPVEAWIEADAKDRQGRVVLPQGSRVFGSYDTGAALGQKRLVVRWTSVELPNGVTVALDGAESAGRDGAGGMRGKVDARIWGAFGRALFLSAIGAAAQLGQPQESATLGAAASNRQVAAASVATELSRAAADVIRQATDIKPVIRVPAGAQFHVFVPADFELR